MAASFVMKRNIILPLGILAPGILAACVTCHAGVYAQAIYSGGTSYAQVCSTTLPFPPFEYNLTEISWREDNNGLTIIDMEHKAAPGDSTRLYLEGECGLEKFYLQLDSGPPTRFKSSEGLPIVKGSGDFAPMVLQFVANRGGRATTNAPPTIEASWIRGSRTNEDIFVVAGDHFAEVQNLLEQAYGKPDAAIPSSTPAGGHGRSINYSPPQIGVLLNLTVTWDDKTIVSIIGKQKP